ncbi:PfkB family carbohydrate kinase [Aquabacterium sp.]|uniref:PfkB family carbohydrate kinase n=1 Tax=Aquabacterium sp. TaxID=1872578 RepID=UPI002E37B85E|nr:PfkB family carbohydrate kinase [Aquabacterium sp.]HEX5312124.1 PfkB family carbohydrate kinase [Aquabacterium sp.]
MRRSPPIVWSIAGLDTAGGAGLSADQRAADALGVHLCPITAALTAQHSQGVDSVFPVPVAQLEAQLQALTDDLPPRAIKTGLLGSVAAIMLVAEWVDRLRARTPAGQDPHRQLALVVDPVLGATSGGAPFSDEAIVAAYRQWLIPRATVLTPNRAEARRLLGHRARHDGDDEVPSLALSLLEMGARSVVITGGDAPVQAGATQLHCVDWLHTPHAHGWLTAPRVNTRHTHGSGCTFAAAMAAALACHHVEADAAVLARMVTHHALTCARAAGQGRGPVLAQRGWAGTPDQPGAPLPWLGIGSRWPWRMTHSQPFLPFVPPEDGLYGIVSTADQLEAALELGLRCIQLRHKPAATLAEHLMRSQQAAQKHGALLFVNDHWESALANATPPHNGLHLGQEDLLGLTPQQLDRLQAAGPQLVLGLSSHSLWELARAAGCGASLIACGPIKPTSTKDMPWRPQGTHNLLWWVEHSPSPVVAIGGLLTPADVAEAARCRPAAVCVVRGLGHDSEEMAELIPPLQAAIRAARQQPGPTAPDCPHAVLT